MENYWIDESNTITPKALNNIALGDVGSYAPISVISTPEGGSLAYERFVRAEAAITLENIEGIAKAMEEKRIPTDNRMVLVVPESGVFEGVTILSHDLPPVFSDEERPQHKLSAETFKPRKGFFQNGGR